MLLEAQFYLFFYLSSAVRQILNCENISLSRSSLSPDPHSLSNLVHLPQFLISYLKLGKYFGHRNPFCKYFCHGNPFSLMEPFLSFRFRLRRRQNSPHAAFCPEVPSKNNATGLLCKRSQAHRRKNNFNQILNGRLRKRERKAGNSGQV